MDPITLNLRVGREPPASEPVGGELSAAQVDANWSNLKIAAEQLDAEKAPKEKYISTTAPDPEVTTDWYLPTGEHYIWDGDVWFSVPGISSDTLASLFVGKVGNQSIAGDLLVERETGTEVDFGVRGYGVGPVIHGYMANGTKVSPTSITSGQLVFGIGARPYAGSGFTAHSTSAIHMVATENHSGTNQGTDFRILVTPLGKTEADRITAVRYYAPANGLRIRHRMHGTDADRAKYQTDVDGENTSFTVVPATGGLASNLQARSSETADFSRGYLQATTTAVELVSDAGGAGTVRPLTVKVGATTTQTHNADGSITHQAGTRLGSDAPSLKVKKLTGTTSATAGATTSIAHGLTGANIRGIVVEVRPAADPSQGFPPGVSFASPNRQYEAFFGGANIAITTHPTNSSAILSSSFTVLVIYEV